MVPAEPGVTVNDGNTLLERLARAELGERAPRTSGNDQSELRNSILCNLRDVLATRRGSAPAQLDLGTPSPNELRQKFPSSVSELQRSIADCIRRYEPRLRDIEVSYVQVEGEALNVHFQIHAQLLMEGKKRPISFETTVDHRGKWQLQD
jgi:type VI secretion system protein